jgi:hypothetical protein
VKMMTCKDASRLISEGQERPLGRSERWSLRFHLWLCDNCRRFDRQIRFIRQAMQSLGSRVETDEQGPKLSPDAKDRIRQSLSEQDRSSS